MTGPLDWTLAEAAAATHGVVDGDASTRIHSVSTDSRSVTSGALFVAIKGEHHDGHMWRKSQGRFEGVEPSASSQAEVEQDGLARMLGHAFRCIQQSRRRLESEVGREALAQPQFE